MPAGFQAINDSGFVQIDADYKNFRFRQRGATTLPQSSSGAPVYDSPAVSADITAANPLVFFRANAPDLAAAYVGCYVVKLGTNSHRIWFRGASANYAMGIDWWVFDTLPPSLGSNGMQVFDGSGAVVFDSNDLGMRLLDVIPHYISSNPSYSYGPQIAVAAAGSSGRAIYTNGAGSYREQLLATGMRSFAGNSVQMGACYIRSRTFGGNVSNPGTYNSSNPTFCLIGNMDGL